MSSTNTTPQTSKCRDDSVLFVRAIIRSRSRVPTLYSLLLGPRETSILCSAKVTHGYTTLRGYHENYLELYNSFTAHTASTHAFENIQSATSPNTRHREYLISNKPDTGHRKLNCLRDTFYGLGVVRRHIKHNSDARKDKEIEI